MQRLKVTHNTGGDWRAPGGAGGSAALGAQRLDLGYTSRKEPHLPSSARKLPADWRWSAKGCELRLSPRTGLVESYSHRGHELLGKGLMPGHLRRPRPQLDLRRSRTGIDQSPIR